MEFVLGAIVGALLAGYFTYAVMKGTVEDLQAQVDAYIKKEVNKVRSL